MLAAIEVLHDSAGDYILEAGARFGREQWFLIFTFRKQILWITLTRIYFQHLHIKYLSFRWGLASSHLQSP